MDLGLVFGSHLCKNKTNHKNNFFFFFFFFFFLISKKTNILKVGGSSQKYTGSGQKEPTNQKTQKPKNYLLPNQVRKSTTEFVLTTLDTLAQVHKLVTKFDLSF